MTDAAAIIFLIAFMMMIPIGAIIGFNLGWKHGQRGGKKR